MGGGALAPSAGPIRVGFCFHLIKETEPVFESYVSIDKLKQATVSKIHVILNIFIFIIRTKHCTFCRHSTYLDPKGKKMHISFEVFMAM
jgi:hypothetical protein